MNEEKKRTKTRILSHLVYSLLVWHCEVGDELRDQIHIVCRDADALEPLFGETQQLSSGHVLAR